MNDAAVASGAPGAPLVMDSATAGQSGRRLGDRALLLLLASITAVGAVTLNIYLPARPAVQAEFHASVAATGLTVSLAGVAFACGLLGYGPWSDRRGRRPVILAGLGLFTLGTTICFAATSMLMLIVGRIVQALGSAAGITIGRAVVSDVFPRDDVARRLAYLTMVVAIANALAPSAGGLITQLFHWRAVFGVLFLAAVTIAALAWRHLPETLPTSQPRSARPGVASTVLSLATQRAFLACSLQTSAVYATFLVFASYMPFVMTASLGGTVASYGAWYLLIAIGYFLGNFTVTRLAGRLGNARLLRAGSLIQMLAAVVTLALALLGARHPLAVFVPWLVLAFGQGLILPSVTAAAVALRPDAAGTAAGLLGFVQQIAAAIAVQAMATASVATPLPVDCFVAATCVASFLLALGTSPLLERGPAQLG